MTGKGEVVGLGMPVYGAVKKEREGRDERKEKREEVRGRGRGDETGL